jgi:hypothetical protein
LTARSVPNKEGGGISTVFVPSLFANVGLLEVRKNNKRCGSELQASRDVFARDVFAILSWALGKREKCGGIVSEGQVDVYRAGITVTRVHADADLCIVGHLGQTKLFQLSYL